MIERAKITFLRKKLQIVLAFHDALTYRLRVAGNQATANRLKNDMNGKELHQKRLDAYLDTPRWSDGKGGTVTMRQRIAGMAILGKSTTVEHYARKKRGGCYAKLKSPKVTYWIDYRQGSEDFALEVPKMVFDWLIAVETSKA